MLSNAVMLADQRGFTAFGGDIKRTIGAFDHEKALVTNANAAKWAGNVEPHFAFQIATHRDFKAAVKVG